MNYPVIFDTDMKFGLPGAPVDSGLALLYLLGKDNIDIKGITITGSNKSLSETRDAVSWILRLNRKTDIPIIDGSPGKGIYKTAASDFLAETSASLKREITILTTGSPANIHGASRVDKYFYSNAKQIICTGGLLHPLQVPGWTMKNDIAFSHDPAAAENVLAEARKLVLMNMHIGSQIVLSIDDLPVIRRYNIQLYYLVKEYLLSDTCRVLNGKPAAYLWSMLPAVYIGKRNLFHEVKKRISPKKANLEKGILSFSESGNQLIMPDYVTDIDDFYHEMHEGMKMCPFREWPEFQSLRSVVK